MMRVIKTAVIALAIFGCASEDLNGSAGSVELAQAPSVDDAYVATGQLVPLPATGDFVDIAAGDRTAAVLRCTGRKCVPSGRIAILATPAPRSASADDIAERLVAYARAANGDITGCGMTDELERAIDVVRDIADGDQAIDETGELATKVIVVERGGTGALVTVPLVSFPQLPAQMTVDDYECNCIPGAIGNDCTLTIYAGIRFCEKGSGCPECRLEASY